jgi:hypothetical protein
MCKSCSLYERCSFLFDKFQIGITLCGLFLIQNEDYHKQNEDYTHYFRNINV